METELEQNGLDVVRGVHLEVANFAATRQTVRAGRPAPGRSRTLATPATWNLPTSPQATAASGRTPGRLPSSLRGSRRDGALGLPIGPLAIALCGCATFIHDYSQACNPDSKTRSQVLDAPQPRSGDMADWLERPRFRMEHWPLGLAGCAVRAWRGFGKSQGL